jgi:hypothetical protein
MQEKGSLATRRTKSPKGKLSPAVFLHLATSHQPRAIAISSQHIICSVGFGWWEFSS